MERNVNVMNDFSPDFIYKHRKTIMLMAIVLVASVIFNQELKTQTTVSESEKLFVIEPSNQYHVSEIMEKQEDVGVCMFPFVIVENYGYPSGNPYKYPYGNVNNNPPTAFVRDIRFSESGVFTAIAVRPIAVEIALYDNKGEIYSRTIARSSPPFQRETAKTFFGIDSDQAVLLVSARLPSNFKEADKISIRYIKEDRTAKSHLPLFLLYHISLKTQNSGKFLSQYVKCHLN
ncbi:MAG: hypothetical protein U9P70_04635 [Patescibacteria group bacterium]|nr:hypothetical protein [Patescibacteria group bacterium]